MIRTVKGLHFRKAQILGFLKGYPSELPEAQAEYDQIRSALALAGRRNTSTLRDRLR